MIGSLLEPSYFSFQHNVFYKFLSLGGGEKPLTFCTASYCFTNINVLIYRFIRNALIFFTEQDSAQHFKQSYCGASEGDCSSES